MLIIYSIEGRMGEPHEKSEHGYETTYTVHISKLFANSMYKWNC